MNYKILLGILLAVVFYFWVMAASYLGLQVPAFGFWTEVMVDFFILIVLFSAVSFFRAMTSKKYFEGNEVYQITSAFIASMIVFAAGFGVMRLQAYDIGIMDTVGFALYISIRTFAVTGTALLFASYFLNIFQGLMGAKSKLNIPLSYQIKVTMGLAAALVAIGLIYHWIFEFTVSRYGTTLIFSLLSGVPIIASVILMRKPPGGLKLDRKDHPELFKDLKEVADSIGVSEPKDAFVTPTTEIAVAGIIRKRLILGIATLDKLKRSELKSILAHELGHLYGGDTVIGYIIANISLSLGLIVRFVPSQLIAIVFYLISFVFSFITLAYSRQVEYRADLVSAKLFGGKKFSESLTNYVTYSMFFEKNSPGLIQTLAKEGKVFKNIYEFLGKNFDSEKEKTIRKEMEVRKTSFWSTHPGTMSRAKKVENVKGLTALKDTGKASDYFKDFEKLQGDATVALSYMYHVQQKKK